MLTITTAATDTGLLTIAELRSAANVSDNSRDTDLVATGARVSAAIARVCCIQSAPPTPPTLREEVLSQVFRRVCADELILARRPVTAVASVVVDGVTLAATEYEYQAASGLLYRLCADDRTAWYGSKITVAFTAGWATVPDDLKMIAAKMVQTIWTENTREPGLRRVEIDGVGTKEFWVPSSGDPLFPQEVLDGLGPYMEYPQ